MDKPSSVKDLAFELYIRNYTMPRIVTITDTDENTINQWILQGNWQQLKEDLDSTPLLRDLGRRVDPERRRLILLGFIARVLKDDFALGTRLYKIYEQYISATQSFPGKDIDPAISN